jgi:glycosyltransferase involved in cell wall biosynthesis
MADRPPRIALVYDAVYPYQKGGGERRFRAIADQLSAAGHEVDLYGMRSWAGRDPVRVADRVRLHGLCRARPLYTASGRRSIVQSLVFGVSCLRLLGRRFDVIDCCGFPFFSLFACRLVASVRRKPLISTWHEVWGAAYWKEYLGPAGGRIGAQVERLAVALPDRIICVSGTTASRLRRELGCRKPVFLLPNGVDLALAAGVEPIESTVDVVFAGRLIAEKNVDLLLRALHRLAATTEPAPGETAAAGPVRCAPLHCLIVGDGPERGRLERLCADLRLAGSVTFAGHLPDARDVLAAMKAAKVLVLPSRREGFGMVVLEANACGVPVLTVRHPGNAATELIQEGRNGWVVPPDAAALADALRRAVDGPQPAAVGACVDRYSWGRIARRYALTALYQAAAPVAGASAGGPADGPVPVP